MEETKLSAEPFHSTKDWAAESASNLELIHFADPIMTTRPTPFNFETDGKDAGSLSVTLRKRMLDLKGAGLSANQIGIPVRVFVFGNEEKTITMFNPQVMGVSKEFTKFEEGCLSFPGFFLTLQRPASVLITWQDEVGEYQTGEFTGIAARIILHEYDHMEGINFTAHASPFKLKYTLDRWKKKQIRQMRKANGKRI